MAPIHFVAIGVDVCGVLVRSTGVITELPVVLDKYQSKFLSNGGGYIISCSGSLAIARYDAILRDLRLLVQTKYTYVKIDEPPVSILDIWKGMMLKGNIPKLSISSGSSGPSSVHPVSSLSSANSVTEVVDLDAHESLNPLIEQNIQWERLPPKISESLLSFQRSGVQFGVARRGRLLLADEMGLGKTVQSIAIASYFVDQWPLLIICPASVCRNWQNELLNWLPGFTASHIQIVGGRSDPIAPEGSDVRVVILSFEKAVSRFVDVSKSKLKASGKSKGLSVNNNLEHGCELVAGRFKALIIDECHMLKSAESKRSQVGLALSSAANVCIMLSGTPALNRPAELHSQLKCVDPGFMDFQKFAIRYCGRKIVNGPTFKTKSAFQKSNTAHGGFLSGGLHNSETVDDNGASFLWELGILLRTLMLRRRKAVVLKMLPPKVRHVVRVPLMQHSNALKGVSTSNSAQGSEENGIDTNSFKSNLESDDNYTVAVTVDKPMYLDAAYDSTLPNDPSRSEDEKKPFDSMRYLNALQWRMRRVLADKSAQNDPAAVYLLHRESQMLVSMMHRVVGILKVKAVVELTCKILEPLRGQWFHKVDWSQIDDITFLYATEKSLTNHSKIPEEVDEVDSTLVNGNGFDDTCCKSGDRAIPPLEKCTVGRKRTKATIADANNEGIVGNVSKKSKFERMPPEVIEIDDSSETEKVASYLDDSNKTTNTEDITHSDTVLIYDDENNVIGKKKEKRKSRKSSNSGKATTTSVGIESSVKPQELAVDPEVSKPVSKQMKKKVPMKRRKFGDITLSDIESETDGESTVIESDSSMSTTDSSSSRSDSDSRSGSSSSSDNCSSSSICSTTSGEDISSTESESESMSTSRGLASPSKYISHTLATPKEGYTKSHSLSDSPPGNVRTETNPFSSPRHESLLLSPITQCSSIANDNAQCALSLDIDLEEGVIPHTSLTQTEGNEPGVELIGNLKKVQPPLVAGIDQQQQQLDNPFHEHHIMDDKSQSSDRLNDFSQTSISKTEVPSNCGKDGETPIKKVVIFAHHKVVLMELSRYLNLLGIVHVRIDGDSSPARKDRDLRAFQTLPTVQVALVGITAAGVGLSFVAASAAIFAELHFVPGVVLQAEDRLHRLGQRAKQVDLHYVIGIPQLSKTSNRTDIGIGGQQVMDGNRPNVPSSPSSNVDESLHSPDEHTWRMLARKLEVIQRAMEQDVNIPEDLRYRLGLVDPEEEQMALSTESKARKVAANDQKPIKAESSNFQSNDFNLYKDDVCGALSSSDSRGKADEDALSMNLLQAYSSNKFEEDDEDLNMLNNLIIKPINQRAALPPLPNIVPAVFPPSAAGTLSEAPEAKESGREDRKDTGSVSTPHLVPLQNVEPVKSHISATLPRRGNGPSFGLALLPRPPAPLVVSPPQRKHPEHKETKDEGQTTEVARFTSLPVENSTNSLPFSDPVVQSTRNPENSDDNDIVRKALLAMQAAEEISSQSTSSLVNSSSQVPSADVANHSLENSRFSGIASSNLSLNTPFPSSGTKENDHVAISILSQSESPSRHRSNLSFQNYADYAASSPPMDQKALKAVEPSEIPAISSNVPKAVESSLHNSLRKPLIPGTHVVVPPTSNNPINGLAMNPIAGVENTSIAYKYPSHPKLAEVHSPPARPAHGSHSMTPPCPPIKSSPPPASVPLGSGPPTTKARLPTLRPPPPPPPPLRK